MSDMTPRGHERGTLLRRGVRRGAPLAVLAALLLWSLLRSTWSTDRSLGGPTSTASHLRRIAELRPVTLTGLVSKGRSTRVARFLSAQLPGITGREYAKTQADEAAMVQPPDVGRIWEYLLGEASRTNIGWEVGQPEDAEAQEYALTNHSDFTHGGTDQLQAPSSTLSQAAAADGMASAPTAPHLPDTFDWHTYLMYYPDLRMENITTEAGAQQHYLEYGRAEHRVYRRLRVLLRYTACTGLMNQHYSHIAAFTLAAAVNAELVLPPAVQRDSFGHYFSQQKELNEVVWAPAPLEWLLDVDRIIGHWAGRGMTVHKAICISSSLPHLCMCGLDLGCMCMLNFCRRSVPALMVLMQCVAPEGVTCMCHIINRAPNSAQTPALLPFPDLTEPQTAFPLYPQPELDPQYITRLPSVYLQVLVHHCCCFQVAVPCHALFSHETACRRTPASVASACAEPGAGKSGGPRAQRRGEACGGGADGTGGPRYTRTIHRARPALHVLHAAHTQVSCHVRIFGSMHARSPPAVCLPHRPLHKTRPHVVCHIAAWYVTSHELFTGAPAVRSTWWVTSRAA